MHVHINFIWPTTNGSASSSLISLIIIIQKVEFIRSPSVNNESMSDFTQKLRESLEIQHLGDSAKFSFAKNWDSAKDH